MKRKTLRPMRPQTAGFVLLFVVGAACSQSHVVADKTATMDEDEGEATTVSGSGGSGSGGSQALPEKPACQPSADSELSCNDGEDDDCDGFVDCQDTECEGVSCGSGDGFACSAGACLAPGDNGLPELPRIDNVGVDMLGSTAIVTFQPVDGARDYRVYPLPDPDEVLVGEDGEVVIPGAIYRCAGDRPAVKRSEDAAGFYDASLTTEERIHGYVRPEGSELLGYVYLTPGADREAVYRIADPNRKGAYTWPHLASWDRHYHGAEYTRDEALREELVQAGQIDNGVAFYAPTDGDLTVHRRIYEEGQYLAPLVYYTDGPEADHRADHGGDHSTPFSIFEEQREGTAPLYRVYYLYEGGHDTLAAGEPEFERALEQGNIPFWSLTWPGLLEDTTLVIEALDEGCPFPGGYISAHSAPGDPEEGGYYATLTLDEARLDSEEVFFNGQHDPSNRPKPIARAYVDVSPQAEPDMDWYESFDDPSTFGELEEFGSTDHGLYNKRNDDWIVEMTGCAPGVSVGPLLGQLALGGGDGGSSCNMSVIRRNMPTPIKSDSYLHVRMTTEIPSTRRRYPQLMVTTVPVLEPDEVNITELAVRSRTGPFPFEDGYQPGQGDYHTLIVQPFGPEHELQIEFCNRRAWGVSAQCPRANVYGFHASTPEEPDWDLAWNPVPILGELAGHDRPVRFDSYLSTDRVYVYVDNEPAGCAVLPANQMPEGDVTVIFGSVIYHGGIDESVTSDNSPHQYLKRYSLVHYDRHFDEVGIDREVQLPGWDETRLPCGKDWYGEPE